MLGEHCSEDRALTLHICRDVHVELLALFDTHLGCEGSGWSPLRGSTWRGLLHHLIDLFERKALRMFSERCQVSFEGLTYLGLWNEEVGVHEGTCAEGAPYEEDVRAQVTFVRAHRIGSGKISPMTILKLHQLLLRIRKVALMLVLTMHRDPFEFC